MRRDFFEGVSMKVRIAFVAMLALPMIIPFMLIGLFAKPIDYSLILGCYTAPGARPLEIRPDAIHLIEPDRRAIVYQMETRTDVRMTLNSELRLRREPDSGYVFEVGDTPGSLSLLPADGKDRVRSMASYSGRIRVRAGNGEEVIYSRSASQRSCR